jgi:hypothetical protein
VEPFLSTCPLEILRSKFHIFSDKKAMFDAEVAKQLNQMCKEEEGAGPKNFAEVVSTFSSFSRLFG